MHGYGAGAILLRTRVSLFRGKRSTISPRYETNAQLSILARRFCSQLIGVFGTTHAYCVALVCVALSVVDKPNCLGSCDEMKSGYSGRKNLLFSWR